MIASSRGILHESSVVPALRELFSQHPATTHGGSETLARLLSDLGYLPYRPDPFAVEVALEALLVEGEVLG